MAEQNGDESAFWAAQAREAQCDEELRAGARVPGLVPDIPSLHLDPGNESCLAVRALREVLERLPKEEADLVRDADTFSLYVMSARGACLGEQVKRARFLLIMSDAHYPAPGRDCLTPDCADMRQYAPEDDLREADELALSEWRGLWVHELGHAFDRMRNPHSVSETAADWWAYERGFQRDILALS